MDASDHNEYEPVGPRPIQKLSKDVINQIAAAEVGYFHVQLKTHLE